jgi:hypothetical protein
VRIGDGKRWSDIKPVVINNATDVHTKDVMNLRQFCGYVSAAQLRNWTDTDCDQGTNTLSRPKALHTLGDSSICSSAAPRSLPTHSNGKNSIPTYSAFPDPKSTTLKRPRTSRT